MNRSENNREEDANDNNSTLWTAGTVAAGVAAVAGGLYWLMRGSKTPQEQKTSISKPKHKPKKETAPPQTPTSVATSSYLTNLLERITTLSSTESVQREGGIARSSIPLNPSITNLDSLLSDIYVRYIALKDDDFELHYKVFQNIFQKIHQTMKKVDVYYQKYSSTVQFAGSHYDRLRIKKPDEFDMDIVIGLPLNIRNNHLNPDDSDIIIEPTAPGFVQLKMGTQFQRLPMRDGYEWQNNKAAYEWKDDGNYLLRSNCINWFKGVVHRALNTFKMNRETALFYVEGVPYVVRTSESGPAITLIIMNKSTGFRMDVDLVPALKFPEDRWPISSVYRSIPPGCHRGVWMVVPKPNKAALTEQDRNRSWRIALHDQEKKLMYNTNNLRAAIRLIKKLRDAQGMKKIASYYIKTIFFWEVLERNDRTFWSKNSPATLFIYMVRKLHAAVACGNIPYFWNKNNNLIRDVDKATLNKYALKLESLMSVLEQPSQYKHVAKYLLDTAEFSEYRKILHI